jgi:hypothetical protein
VEQSIEVALVESSTLSLGKGRFAEGSLRKRPCTPGGRLPGVRVSIFILWLFPCQQGYSLTFSSASDIKFFIFRFFYIFSGLKKKAANRLGQADIKYCLPSEGGPWLGCLPKGGKKAASRGGFAFLHFFSAAVPTPSLPKENPPPAERNNGVIGVMGGKREGLFR